MKTSSVHLAVLICLTVFYPMAISITTPLITQTCVKLKTYDQQLCIDSLSQVPESEHADVKGLAKIMVDVVLRKHVAETKNKLTDLKKQLPGDQDRLQKCLGYYDVVVSDIDKTVYNYIPFHEYEAAVKSMDDVDIQVMNCEFQYIRPECPVKAENIMAIKLADLAAGIVVL